MNELQVIKLQVIALPLSRAQHESVTFQPMCLPERNAECKVVYKFEELFGKFKN